MRDSECLNVLDACVVGSSKTSGDKNADRAIATGKVVFTRDGIKPVPLHPACICVVADATRIHKRNGPKHRIAVGAVKSRSSHSSRLGATAYRPILNGVTTQDIVYRGRAALCEGGPATLRAYGGHLRTFGNNSAAASAAQQLSVQRYNQALTEQGLEPGQKLHSQEELRQMAQRKQELDQEGQRRIHNRTALDNSEDALFLSKLPPERRQQIGQQLETANLNKQKIGKASNAETTSPYAGSAVAPKSQHPGQQR